MDSAQDAEDFPQDCGSEITESSRARNAAIQEPGGDPESVRTPCDSGQATQRACHLLHRPNPMTTSVSQAFYASTRFSGRNQCHTRNNTEHLYILGSHLHIAKDL